jgi:hypothetical protein
VLQKTPKNYGKYGKILENPPFTYGKHLKINKTMENMGKPTIYLLLMGKSHL